MPFSLLAKKNMLAILHRRWEGANMGVGEEDEYDM
jgi:hypothetical protein